MNQFQNMSKLKSNIIPNSYISLKTSENLNNNFNDNEMEDVKYDKLTKITICNKDNKYVIESP